MNVTKYLRSFVGKAQPLTVPLLTEGVLYSLWRLMFRIGRFVIQTAHRPRLPGVPCRNRYSMQQRSTNAPEPSCDDDDDNTPPTPPENPSPLLIELIQWAEEEIRREEGSSSAT